MQVGWDWASETHDVTVMDSAGQVVDRWSLGHDEVGLDRAIGRLAGHGRPQALPVAIETTNGVVVDRLLAAGHPVVPVHPNAFNATRPRWGAARAKSDPGDSWKLADLLRTDGHRLHQLRPLDPATRHLQALSRLRDDHLEAKTAATNQLGALLDAHWPGAKAIFARLDSPIALAFLERYPTPQAAERLGEGRLAAFCRRHSYSGHRSPAALLARLRAAPVAVNSLDPKVLAACVGAQVQLLRALLASIADLDRALLAALGGHPKTAVLAAMPRIGQVNLAQILAEVGPILDRARDPEHAAAEAGASPVTKQSGKATSVHFRWAANTRARDALATFADNSRHSSPWAAALYRQARRRGKRHPQAVRILMRAWLRVMWACWHADSAYVVNHHGAERRLADQAEGQG
jgi:transposase